MQNHELLIFHTVVLRDLYEHCLYPEAYRYLADIAARRRPPCSIDENQRAAAWLRNAATINENRGAPVSEYMRRAIARVAAGLDQPVTPEAFQQASNALAARIIDHILRQRLIPPTNWMDAMQADIMDQQLQVPRWAWLDVISDVVAALPDPAQTTCGPPMGSTKLFVDLLIEASLPACAGAQAIYGDMLAMLQAAVDHAVAMPAPQLRDHANRGRRCDSPYALHDGSSQGSFAVREAGPPYLTAVAYASLPVLNLLDPSSLSGSTRPQPWQADAVCPDQPADDTDPACVADLQETAASPDAQTDPQLAVMLHLPAGDRLGDLPDLPPVGRLPSLHQAIRRDTDGDLRELLLQFARTGSALERLEIVSRLIYGWAGVADISNWRGATPAQQRATGDVRKLSVLKAVLAQDGVYPGANQARQEIEDSATAESPGGPPMAHPSVTSESSEKSETPLQSATPPSTTLACHPELHDGNAPAVRAAFATFEDFIYRRLMAQTRHRALLQRMRLHVNNGSIVCDASDIRQALHEHYDAEPDHGMRDLAEFADMLHVTGRVSLHIRDALRSPLSQSIIWQAAGPASATTDSSADGRSDQDAFDALLKSALSPPSE